MFKKPYPWENKKNILVTTHAFVDPDALGSILSLGSFLERQNKKVTLVAVGGVPRNLRFLVGEREVLSELKQPVEDFDLIIVADCGEIGLPQIPELNKEGLNILNIDHHPDNTGFGGINWVDANYAAACEIIFDLFNHAEHKINAYEATALLAGLMADTGSFRHSNTKSKTLRMAGELLLHGALRLQVVKHLFAGKTVGQLRAWSFVLEKASLDKKNNAIVSALTKEDTEALGVDDEAYEGIVEILNTFPEAGFAAFARQRGDKIKFSLRSEEYKGVDVGRLAAKFGGGGHKLASGFTIPGQLKRDNGNIYIESGDSKVQSSKLKAQK